MDEIVDKFLGTNKFEIGLATIENWQHVIKQCKEWGIITD